VEAARQARDLIPGAQLVELDTDIHLIWLSDVIDDITREIEAFITQTAPPPTVDRALATVLALSGPPGDTVIERHGGRLLPSGALATFDGPAQAIRCALMLVAEDPSLAGAVHSGECELHPDGLRGVAVDVAEQLAATAPAGQVLVTQTVRDLVVGSPIPLQPQGHRTFRNIPGTWQILTATPSATP
jgi:class 3 adenylate cyclase